MQKNPIKQQTIIIVNGVDFAAKIFKDYMDNHKNATLVDVANNPQYFEEKLKIKIETLLFSGSNVPMWFIGFLRRFHGENPHEAYFVINQTF